MMHTYILYSYGYYKVLWNVAGDAVLLPPGRCVSWFIQKIVEFSLPTVTVILGKSIYLIDLPVNLPIVGLYFV